MSNSENPREHLKNFSNVDCEQHNNVQDTRGKIKITNQIPLLLRFSFVTPYQLFPSNTITFNKYFWFSRFCEFFSNPTKRVSIQDIAPNIHWSLKTFCLSQVDFLQIKIYCSLLYCFKSFYTFFGCIFQLVARFPETTFSEVLKQQRGLLLERTNIRVVWPSHRSFSRNQQSNRISQQIVVMVSQPFLLQFIDFLLPGLKRSSSCSFQSFLLCQRKPTAFFTGNIQQYFRIILPFWETAHLPLL